MNTIIENDELDEMLEQYVTKFVASVHLAALAREKGLSMEEMPDFYDVLVENARHWASASAVASGRPKGNRHIYGPLKASKCRGKSGKLRYLPSDLKTWFENNFWPVWQARQSK